MTADDDHRPPEPPPGSDEAATEMPPRPPASQPVAAYSAARAVQSRRDAGVVLIVYFGLPFIALLVALVGVVSIARCDVPGTSSQSVLIGSALALVAPAIVSLVQSELLGRVMIRGHGCRLFAVVPAAVAASLLSFLAAMSTWLGCWDTESAGSGAVSEGLTWGLDLAIVLFIAGSVRVVFRLVKAMSR